MLDKLSELNFRELSESIRKITEKLEKEANNPHRTENTKYLDMAVLALNDAKGALDVYIQETRRA